MKKKIVGLMVASGITLMGYQYMTKSPIPEAKIDRVVSLGSGTALSEPKALPDFKLKDFNKKSFTNKQLYDHWSFVFFGYSQCPGICPATLGKLNELAKLLGPGMAEFVFISIDPENDTASQLKSYFVKAPFEHADFLGVTGELADIQALAKSLNLFVSQDNIKINGHIDHSGTVLLINPEGKLTAVFANANQTQVIARDFRGLVHQYAK